MFRRFTARPSARISVVIPLYNHAAFIGAAIDSALAEDAVHELIIVDDGSTDGSAAIAGGRAADPRVILWSQPNRGAHAALNAGIARATGTHVAILNSDDLYVPGRLAALVAALERDETAWMAVSSVAFIDAAGQTVANAWFEAAVAFGRTEADLGITLLNGNILVSTSNFVIRADRIERIGPFAPLRYAHDLEFALRVLSLGGGIARVGETLLRYRTHGANTIAEDHRRVRTEWAVAAGFYLKGVAERTGEGAAQWSRHRRLLAVLETHRILQGACMAAANPHGVHDPAFRDMLAECV
jgi:glycosyltransferase involved in cell wall biosynthesis